MKVLSIAVIICVLLFCYGCSDLIQTSKDVLKDPLKTDSIRRGMTRDQVSDLWGQPTRTYFATVNEDGVERDREVWVYKADFTMIPVDADYLSKTKYLYFDGESLTNITETELSVTDDK